MPLVIPFSPQIDGFNLKSAEFVSSVNLLPTIAFPNDINSTKNGKKLFVLDIIANSIFEYDNPFCDVNSMEYSGLSLDLGVTGTFSTAFALSADEKRLYVVNLTSDFIYQYNLPNPGSLSGASYSGLSLFVGAQTTTPGGLTIGDNDSKIYIVSYTPPPSIFQYDLSDKLDVSTGAPSGSLDISATSPDGPAGVAIDIVGNRIFSGNLQDRIVDQYDLTTPFSVSTGILSPASFDGGPYAPPPANDNFLSFSTFDGKFLYMCDFTTNSIYQYRTHTLSDKCP